MNEYDIYNKPINNIRLDDKNKKDNSQKEDVMQNALNELINMTELGAVPEYGNYTPIKTTFENENKRLNASEAVLSIEPSILLDERPMEREIKIKVFSKDKYHSYSVTLFRGEKSDILEKLKGDDIKKEIQDFIELSCEKFNEL